MEKNFSKEYECPVCALKAWLIERLELVDEIPDDVPFFQSIVNEMKLSGLCSHDWQFFYDAKQGVVADQAILNQTPLDKMLPAYSLKTEICATCGTIYAKKLTRGSARKQPKLVVPGNIPPFGNNLRFN